MVNRLSVTSKTVSHQMSHMNGHTVALFPIGPKHSKLSSTVLKLITQAFLAKFVIRLILTILKKGFLMVSLDVPLCRFFASTLLIKLPNKHYILTSSYLKCLSATTPVNSNTQQYHSDSLTLIQNSQNSCSFWRNKVCGQQGLT